MAEVERALSTAELNRALLARQMLLERKSSSLPKAVERIGGIQAQYAPSMYVGLWTRLEDFDRSSLTRALERRALVQGTLLRATIHLVTPADWWRFSAAVRRQRRERWLGARKKEPTAKQMAAGTRRLRKRLAEGVAERDEVQELIGQGSRGTNGASIWTDLVRVPPSGTWERRRADLFAEAERWIGPDPEPGEKEATVETVCSYLRGFGPATGAEIADWIGVPNTQVAKALEQVELRSFRGPDGQQLVDLPRAPLPDPETPAPVRFLPIWDATLLTHARRTQILPDRYRNRVFNPKTPQSIATFTVDGAVAGSWRYEKGRLKTEPFERLDGAARRLLKAEAERLADFHA